MFSLSASGNFGGVINAAKFPGQTIIRKQRRGAAFPSRAQRANHAMMAGLQHQYTNLDQWGTGGHKAAWAAAAAGTDLSGYHLYIKTNLALLRADGFPSVSPNYSDPGTKSTGALFRAGFKGYISAAFGSLTNNNLPGQCWLSIYWLLLDAAEPVTPQTIAYIGQPTILGVTQQRALIERVRPGTYWVRSRVVTTDGRGGGSSSTSSVVVT